MMQNSNEKIKIGALLPLTGKNKRYGLWIKEALELGKDEINLREGINGKELDIVYEDDVANPKKAVSGMKKLSKKINVPIIFGSWASSCVTAQIPIAKKTKTIIITEAIAPKMKGTGGYALRIQPETGYYLKKLVPYVYFSMKIKKVAILYAKNDFGITQANTFKELFENLGGEIIFNQSFSQGKTDFKTELTKIKKKNPEALFIPAYTEIISVLNEAKKLRLKTKFLASVPFENKDIILKTGDAAEGVIYPYHYAPDPNNEVDVRFRREYKMKYKIYPEGFAALAYDGIHIIAQVLENWDWKDRESLKDEFYRVYHFGVNGEIIFSNLGTPIQKVIIKTVKRGKFIRVKEPEEKLYLRTVGRELPNRYYK